LGWKQKEKGPGGSERRNARLGEREAEKGMEKGQGCWRGANVPSKSGNAMPVQHKEENKDEKG